MSVKKALPFKKEEEKKKESNNLKENKVKKGNLKLI